MTVPSYRSARLRGAALGLASGALLLAGLSACGSSDDTAADPDVTPAAATSSDAGSTISVTATPTGDPAAGATASDDATDDGIAPASITIESPENGKEVSSTLSISGTANSPEGNVPWQIDSPTDGILVSGAATADGWIDKAYPWSEQIDVSALQPGTYTFTARVDDDSNHEGSKPPSATITFVKK